jgi:hypothetical protein
MMPPPAEVVDVDLQPESPKFEIPTVQEFQRSHRNGSFVKNSDDNIKQELIN